MTHVARPRPASPPRPRRPSEREQLRAGALRAVERLRELLEHEDPHVALAAARELLDRSALQTPPETGLSPRIWKGGAEGLVQDRG